MKFCILLVLPLILSTNSFAQKIIVGKVVEAENQQAIGFASVIARNSKSNTLISGTKTSTDGSFIISVDTSVVTLESRFIGFENNFRNKVHLTGDTTDVGTIEMELISKELEEVTVRAEKSTTEFRLDKRVFNVGKDISSSGASALEILNHVPSVTVDLEGAIALRGSQGVQLLIDGKPSIMSDDPSNALGTITADMVEKIEVITNPSAKYQSEGTSGILNIILKKEEKEGINGSISVNTGIPHNHSIGFSLNRRTEKFNLFTQGGVGYRSLPRYQRAINSNLNTGSKIESEGVNYRNEQFYNIVLGADYHINSWNVLTLSGNFAYEIEEQPSETDFIQSIGDSTIATWQRKEVTEAGNPKWQYDLQYKKQFKDTSEHVLLFSALGRFFGKEKSSDFENRTTNGAISYPLQRTATAFEQATYTYKLDYTKPFNKTFQLESGAHYEQNDVGNKYQVDNNYDNNNWQKNDSLTNDFSYNQSVLGIYSTGAYEKGKFGVLLGLRMELTDLKTELKETNERNHQIYHNLFPTFHTSYKFSKAVSIQAGYSRRIFRPRLWDLNPFFNISNNFNIRRGNPNLQPEFSDSYELTSIYIFDKLSLNLGIYYRHTTETVERISIYENNVNTTTPMNIGTNDLTGVEFNGKYSPLKWLSINGDFNYNYFNRKGEFQTQNFDFEGNQWQSKLMTQWKLSKFVDVELTGHYRSGYKTIQGKQEPVAFLNAGLRVKLLKGKAVINIGARDVFASRIRITLVEQEDYYLYSRRTRGRFLTLGFTYGFGKGEAMTYSGRRH